MPIFRLGELFCGPGGIAWGALHADIGNPNFKIIHQWANDYDKNTCETYIHNILLVSTTKMLGNSIWINYHPLTH